MKTVQFQVEGMTCGHCQHAVEGAMKAVGAEGSVDLASGQASVRYDEAALSFETIRDAIEEEGYKVRTAGAGA